MKYVRKALHDNARDSMRRGFSARTAVVISLILSVASLGCTHTQTVRPDSAQFDAVRHKVLDERVTVTLVNRQVYQDVTLTGLTPDSVSWRAPGGETTTVPTADVFAVRHEKKNKVRGALEGLGLGFSGGVLSAVLAVGIAAALADDEDDDDGFELLSPAEAFAIVTAGFGAIGGLLSLPIGAIRGSRKKYHLEPPPSPVPASSTSITAPEHRERRHPPKP
jgi:hypothetical protein